MSSSRGTERLRQNHRRTHNSAQWTAGGVAGTDGKCLTFYWHRAFVSGLPERVGARQASTFLGFCERHDDEMFAPLEKGAFIGTNEQAFLLAYRAECRELSKQASSRSQQPIGHLLDRGRSPDAQRAIQAFYREQGDEVEKGFRDALWHKQRLDRELLARSFDQLSHLFLRFRGPVCVASSGAPSPENSLAKWRPQAFFAAMSQLRGFT